MRFISYLFITAVASLYATEYPHIPLSSIKNIPYTMDHLARTNRLRCAWLDEKTNLYYKLWHPRYTKSCHFLHAVECGFYDEANTLLVALIFSGDTCCGYVSKNAEKNNHDDCGIALTPFKYHRHTMLRMANADEQSNEYQELFDDLIARTKKHGIVYVDFNPKNIVWDQDRYFLIDLEYLTPLHELKKHFFTNNFLPEDYRELIKQVLYEQTGHLQKNPT